MSAKVNQKIEELKEVLRDEMPNSCTSVKIFFNCNGVRIESNNRTAEELKRDGISMRNLKGDWIK